jgi:hypothetical protein
MGTTRTSGSLPSVVTFLDTCLACGDALVPALSFAGSLRCHDCRADEAPLRPELVQQVRVVEAGAFLQLSPRPERERKLAA